MKIVQVHFLIPEDIEIGLATGLYSRLGGVIRYANGPNKGRIVKHLSSVQRVPKQASSVIGKVLGFLSRPKTIILGSVLVGIVLVCYNNMKERKSKKLKMALNSYIEAIRKGNMNIDKIDDLMGCLDEHKKYKSNIQLTAEELGIIVGLIYDYTVELAKANDVDLSDEKLVQQNNSDTIINLETYLQVQKRVFIAVAWPYRYVIVCMRREEKDGGYIFLKVGGAYECMY